MNFSSIRFKLIVGGILTVLIPMAVSGYIAITNSSNAVIRLSKVNERYIAEGSAMQVAATLKEELNVAAAFAARTQVNIAAEAVGAKGIEGAAAAVGVIRQDMQKRFELLKAHYAAIFLTDATGTIYAKTAAAGEALKGWDIARQPAFQEAKSTRKTVSGEIVRSPTTNEPLMVICAPVFSENGSFLGVFGALLKASVLTDLVTARKIGETGYCFMINASGIIIAHPDEKNVLRLDLKTVEGMENISRAMMAGQDGAESYVFKGTDKVAGFVPIKQKGWSIAATQNTSEFLTSVVSLRNSIAFLLLFAVVVTSVIIFMAATSITRPLKKAIAGALIIGGGDLEHRIEVEGNDEFAELSQSFNAMTTKLSGSYRDLENEIEERKRAEAALEKLNEELEIRVAERTEALRTSVESLQREVDNRKRAEARLQATLKDLERSNKELEQFAYVASHDMQEPLRMVSSYTQLLAQRYEDQLDDKAKKFIGYAVDGAVRMQRLINDLLAYSRVNSQGTPPETVDSHAVLGEALRNLATAIKENQAIILNDDLPTVRADATQLGQLFQNLIGNAIKFKGADLPRIHISASDLGHEWRFSVTDNGIGIEEQYAEKVFVIFQRLHTRLEYPGTGIGLAICKRIVERHGGRIWFESGPGKGSTFYFTLPK